MIRTLLVVTSLVGLSSSLSAAVVGDGAIVHNTLIDAQTGGAEFYVGSENATIADPGLDFDDFLGLYDVDFAEDSVSMSLIGNSALDGVPLLFPGDPNPRFDTYYYFFDSHDVTSVSLDTASGELAPFTTVGIVAAGDLSFVNETVTSDTAGFFVSFGPGADYSTFLPDNPLASVSVDFETQAVPEPSSMSIWVLLVAGCFAVRRRKRRTQS